MAPGTALAARRLLPGRGGGGAGGARAAAAVRPAPTCQRLRRAVQQRQQQQQLLHPGQRLAAGLRRGAVRQRRAAAGGRQARALHQAACALLAAADQPVGHSRQRTWSSSACHSSTRPPALRAVERPVVVSHSRTGTTPAHRHDARAPRRAHLDCCVSLARTATRAARWPPICSRAGRGLLDDVCGPALGPQRRACQRLFVLVIAARPGAALLPRRPMLRIGPMRRSACRVCDREARAVISRGCSRRAMSACAPLGGRRYMMPGRLGRGAQGRQHLPPGPPQLRQLAHQQPMPHSPAAGTPAAPATCAAAAWPPRSNAATSSGDRT